jgi:hypothetical protein
MKKHFSRALSLYLLVTTMILTPAFAQDADDIVKNTQNDIMLVAGAGTAGAILGLSTLSFVDKPSKHISNVWTGAAIGVIAGVIVVAYNSAQKGSEDLMSSKDFNSLERVAWHDKNVQNLTFQDVQYGTQFWQLNF